MSSLSEFTLYQKVQVVVAKNKSMLRASMRNALEKAKEDIFARNAIENV
jgi:hypothetical protein